MKEKFPDPINARLPTIPIFASSGETLDAFAVRMVELAKKHNALVIGCFAGEELRCRPHTTPQQITVAYHSRPALLRKISLPSDQKRLDECLGRLTTLNFEDTDALLDWLREFSAASRVPEVRYNIQEVLDIFAEYGYLPTVPQGKSPSNDAPGLTEIVGIYLAELRTQGAIYHKITHICEFLRDRLRRFN